MPPASPDPVRSHIRWVIGHAVVRITTVCLLIGVMQATSAAGFALIEQSVPDLGTAYAGTAATADSIDTLWFNPAGITRLPGTRAAAAVHVVIPQNRFSDEGSSFVTGAPLGGGNGGDAGGAQAVPHLYLSHQVSETLWTGLAVNAPFGLTTHYDEGWVGRYHALKSSVKTVNINPSMALRINERISLGIGVSAMYIDAELTNAVDFGLLTAGPGAAGTLDGKSDIRGDSWGYGYNLGALFELSPRTRVGVHYRSEVSQDIDGDVQFELPSPALAGTFSDAAVATAIDLPASLSSSAYHELDAQWAVVADYTWTGWSSIPELRFRFDNGLPDGVSTYDWKDTSRLSLGARFAPEQSSWTYRFGVAYDESPIRSAELRTPRLPDADRYWLTLGAGVAISDQLRIDIGYAHLFVDEPRIDKTATGEDLARGALKGQYDASVDIIAVEASYRF